jgi:mannosyl-3-phosphoglycerate phosphatase
MTKGPDLLIFSDLDGTLLDHDTYQWTAALPALRALRRIKAGLVLASSKTAPEIAGLRAQIGFDDWPAIVENGAGLLPAGTQAIPEGGRYHAVRAALDRVPPPLRTQFCGFGDLDCATLAQRTGLPVAQAALAQQRAFSEPGSWSGSEQDLHRFLDHLAAEGIIGQRGGRFVTLSFGGNKADQVRSLTRQYHPRHSIALGDAPNDIKMLEAVDYAVVVANPHSPPLAPLKTEQAGRVYRTTAPGPQGWNDAILTLLSTLTLKGT